MNMEYNILEHINSIDDISNGIDLSLSLLYNHFFEEFRSELESCNKLAPGVCGYLETFADLVELAADRIHDENERLKAVGKEMYSAYRAEFTKGA